MGVFAWTCGSRGRLVARRMSFSSNLRFNYKYRPGSDIYIVYNERRDIEGLPTDVVDRTFTVKWTYLMAF